MEISKLFDNIMDLPGIEGVCLFSTEGRMYLNRLPSFLSNDIFADAQRRIVAMYETMDENFLPCDDYMLKFSERWLLLRRSDKNVMLILGGEKANLASTRMVTNMTMKHLNPLVIAQLESGRGAAPAPLAAAPVAAPAPMSAPPFPVKSSTVPPFRTATAPGLLAAVAPAPAPAPVLAMAASASAVAEPVKPGRMYRGRPY